jgi:hypothetical protein
MQCAVNSLCSALYAQGVREVRVHVALAPCLFSHHALFTLPVLRAAFVACWLHAQVVPCAVLATFAHPFTSHLLVFRVGGSSAARQVLIAV